MENEYKYRDHTHCPEKDSPCGIEGSHRCCLCGSLQKESEEYKRECDHGEMCHWKDCAECREFMVRKGFENETATAVSNREKEIAEEVEKKKEKLPYEPRYCQSRNGIYYCGACEQAWEECSCSARNTGYKRALDEVLQILKH